jgi:hypothetical protein
MNNQTTPEQIFIEYCDTAILTSVNHKVILLSLNDLPLIGKSSRLLTVQLGMQV